MLLLHASESNIHPKFSSDSSSACLIGEPCIYCSPLHCPAIQVGARNCQGYSNHERILDGEASNTLSAYAVIFGFIFGILFERLKVWRCISSCGLLPKSFEFCALYDRMRNTNIGASGFSAPYIHNRPASPISEDIFEGDDAKSGEEADVEDEASKTRWRDVRLTRRGSLFATRCLTHF